MSNLRVFDERVLFDPDMDPETHLRLQTAVAATHGNPAEAELHFIQAQLLDPACLATYFALYKFHFHLRQFDKAERAALAGLREAAQQGGFSDAWQTLPRSALEESRTRHGPKPAHFFLFTLKALAFIRLRQGRGAESREILDRLLELDPDDVSGASVIRALESGVQGDDDGGS